MDLSVKMTVIVLGQLMQEGVKPKFAATNPITVQVIVIVRQNILVSLSLARQPCNIMNSALPAIFVRVMTS